MDKPRHESTKSLINSGPSLISNPGQSGKDRDVKIMTAPPSNIPRMKWREIIDEAEGYFVVNSLREEIIRNAMNAIYARYLEKTSYAFVVDCSYRAWLQLFDFMYLKHDPGENVQTIAKRWSYDAAPDSVPPDSWACRRMTINKEQIPSCRESELCTASCSTKSDIRPEISVPSFALPSPVSENADKLSNTEGFGENEREKEGDSKSDIISERSLSSVGNRTSSASLSQRQRSIFTRTISMVRANLPVTTMKMRFRRGSKNIEHVREDKFAEAVQPPEPLDLERLPPNRLDIQYVVVPGHCTKSQNQKTRKSRLGVKK